MIILMILNSQCFSIDIDLQAEYIIIGKICNKNIIHVLINTKLLQRQILIQILYGQHSTNKIVYQV